MSFIKKLGCHNSTLQVFRVVSFVDVEEMSHSAPSSFYILNMARYKLARHIAWSWNFSCEDYIFLVIHKFLWMINSEVCSKIVIIIVISFSAVCKQNRIFCNDLSKQTSKSSSIPFNNREKSCLRRLIFKCSNINPYNPNFEDFIDLPMSISRFFSK